jgi:hypothetical protein
MRSEFLHMIDSAHSPIVHIISGYKWYVCYNVYEVKYGCRM